MTQLSYADLLGMQLDKAVLDYLETQLALSSLRLRLCRQVVLTEQPIVAKKYKACGPIVLEFTALQCGADQALIMGVVND
jgi:hypothetical protein